MLRNFPTPKDDVYRIRDPKNFHAAMRVDVNLLWKENRYLALTTLIMCCFDALAADPGKATPQTFGLFAEKHFPELCALLDTVRPGLTGAEILYRNFRNGFAHERGPKSKFVIVEGHEVENEWAGRFPDLDGQPVGINVDRLAEEFLKLLDLLEPTSSSNGESRP